MYIYTYVITEIYWTVSLKHSRICTEHFVSWLPVCLFLPDGAYHDFGFRNIRPLFQSICFFFFKVLISVDLGSKCSSSLQHTSRIMSEGQGFFPASQNGPRSPCQTFQTHLRLRKRFRFGRERLLGPAAWTTPPGFLGHGGRWPRPRRSSLVCELNPFISGKFRFGFVLPM